MKRGSPRTWHSKAALFRLTRRFLAVFGGFWLLLEPWALWRPDDLRWGFRGYFGLATVSFVFAIYWAWPKTSITRKLPVSDTKIVVSVSDLLAQKGNIIIGFTDFFDTELGDLISTSSIQGQFQTRFFPRQETLDQAIAKELENKSHTIDEQKRRGKKERYKIGTIAVVEAQGNRYFLLAYTRMRQDLRVESDICKLSTALNESWEAIRARGQQEPIHMGIIGSNFARIRLSRALLLQFIILSFLDAEKKESLTSQLTVHIHEKDAEHIDFVDLEAWLTGLTRAA
jgi:Domain of unknown function (DUF6430)